MFDVVGVIHEIVAIALAQERVVARALEARIALDDDAATPLEHGAPIHIDVRPGDFA